MRHPRGRNPNARLSCAQTVLSFTAGPLLWWLAFPVMRLAVPLGVLFIAAFLTTGSYALGYLWMRAARRRSLLTGDAMPQPETPLQAFRSSTARMKEGMTELRQRIVDENITTIQHKALLRPYHVDKEADRLTLTPPSLPPAFSGNVLAFSFSPSLALQRRESWSFWPRQAELTVHRAFGQSKVTSYPVDSVEIGHDIWTSGKGVTDHLRIRGAGYWSKAVVALEYHREVDAQCPLKMGISWGVSPSLAGSAVEHGLPVGVDDGFDSALIAAVAPTILALSRLITEATGCPVSIVIGSCSEPDYSE